MLTIKEKAIATLVVVVMNVLIIAFAGALGLIAILPSLGFLFVILRR